MSMCGIQDNVNMIMDRQQNEYGEVLSNIFQEVSIVWSI